MVAIKGLRLTVKDRVGMEEPLGELSIQNQGPDSLNHSDPALQYKMTAPTPWVLLPGNGEG